MMYTLAHQSVRLRPTYCLIDAVNRPMFEGLKWNPEGLLVRLTEADEFRDFPVPHLALPRLLSGRALSDDERAILDSYARMIDGRIWYLERHAQPAQIDSLLTMRNAIAASVRH